MRERGGSDLLEILRLGIVVERLGVGDLGRAMAAWDYHLSHHEVDLMKLIADGLENDEIAERMGLLDVNTVKKQISSLFRKLGVRKRAQVAGIAGFYGFAAPPAMPPLPGRVATPNG